jgi:hypothetical protein
MSHKPLQLAALALAAAALFNPPARADAVTDWNLKANDWLVQAKLPTPPALRVMAITQAAAFEAANAVTKRYPATASTLSAAPGASVEAAVAAANQATLAQLLPSQQAAINVAYQAALAGIPDGAAKAEGIAVGQKAAAAVLAQRSDDGAAAQESYRPVTAAGVYLPTVIPAIPQWPQRKPWLLASASQFRPGPPPALTSALWARDYNEIKALGAKNNSRRSAEQTEIAAFWDFSMPAVYHGVVRSVADAPGRDLTQNARLFAAVTQAQDDAVIAVFDAKYHYNFWRPMTAIRNGDIDGNDATEREASWLPFIDTPMHPEYPCAHCILAGSAGTVLLAEIGSGPTPKLTTASLTAKAGPRSWGSVADFMQEVALARIYDGVHYRNSTEVGLAMGKQVGALAVAKYLQAPQ